MRPSIATVHWNHLICYGLGQTAPGLLNQSLSSLNLNDGTLGVLTTCGGIWFQFSGIILEKLCCRTWKMKQVCDFRFRLRLVGTNVLILILTLSKLLKYGLQALRTILCAFTCLPSQAKVISTKSSSSLRDSKADVIFVWKLFHRRQNCWSAPILSPLHLVYYLEKKKKQKYVKNMNKIELKKQNIISNIFFIYQQTIRQKNHEKKTLNTKNTRSIFNSKPNQTYWPFISLNSLNTKLNKIPNYKLKIRITQLFKIC